MRDGDPKPIGILICNRGRSVKTCVECGRPATKLCDYPLTGPKTGATCDRDLCGKCAVKRGKNVDYCPTHARSAPNG